jgi:hypothetical protein
MTNKKTLKSASGITTNNCDHTPITNIESRTQNATPSKKIRTNTIKKTPEGINEKTNEFICEICDFKCCKHSDYVRHINTAKHKKRQKSAELPNNNNTIDLCYFCNCGKKYKHASSLWNHKQKCKIVNGVENNKQKCDDFVIDKELVMSIMKQNHELQNQVVELLKKGTHNTTNNNSHNKTFNLQFFLNDTCKNAMNIMDFVNNLQLQLDDLEKMGEIGYVNGMSNIIIKNLKDMDVTERPVHCTDAKREVLYVKDEDKWDKETSDKPKIRKAIKHVAHKNARLLQEFKEKHPDCTKSESKYSDTYTKLMVEAMGGKGSNDDEQESKIIKKVSKEITLDNLNVT